MKTASIRYASIITLALLFLTGAGRARAQGRSKAAQEAAEYLLQKFGREAAREGASTLARKIEVYAARHGDEFLKAVRQVGPRTFHLVEEAGAHGNQAVRVLAQHGEHGATWVVSRPKGMQLFLQHGDEAAATLVRHKGIAEPVIDKLGKPAIRALQATNTQSCRRLSMMVESGEFARIGRSQEVLDVIGRYGDRAMTFVWEHKGALATTAGLTAFLANPEAVMNGTREAGSNGRRHYGQARGYGNLRRHELDHHLPGCRGSRLWLLRREISAPWPTPWPMDSSQNERAARSRAGRRRQN